MARGTPEGSALEFWYIFCIPRIRPLEADDQDSGYLIRMMKEGVVDGDRLNCGKGQILQLGMTPAMGIFVKSEGTFFLDSYIGFEVLEGEKDPGVAF